MKGTFIMQSKVNKIVQWLQQQVKEAHVKGLVVGLSGGLDSAVVTKLIKLACPENSLAVIMPIKSNPADLKDADKVVMASDINSLTIDLTATHDMMFHSIKKNIVEEQAWNNNNGQINDANLRARLRMSTLYAVETNYNYLVVGTDNAAEWHTGYFTKYGDGGVDIQPIIDLTKEEVAKMARFLNLPDAVIEKTPSADLWVGQTDEAELGTSYKYIDRYLEGKTIPAEDKKVIENLHFRTEHKRNIARQLRLK